MSLVFRISSFMQPFICLLSCPHEVPCSPFLHTYYRPLRSSISLPLFVIYIFLCLLLSSFWNFSFPNSFFLKSLCTESNVTWNTSTRMRRLFRVVTNSFTAASACCRGGFRVKWDTLCLHSFLLVFFTSSFTYSKCFFFDHQFVFCCIPVFSKLNN
jgi:hypothetical protein